MSIKFGDLDTGKSQAFLWNEIKSVSLVRVQPFMVTQKALKYEKAIRLDLRNGQEKLIWIRFLSKKERVTFKDDPKI